MASIKNDLTIVKLTLDGTDYQIKCDSIKDTDKQDMETVYSCDSHDPSQIVFGQCEYSLELNGCQNGRDLFIRMRENQKTGKFNTYPKVTTFRYTPNTGAVAVDKIYTEVFIESISGENQENFDVKLIPLNRVYRSPTNRIY